MKFKKTNIFALWCATIISIILLIVFIVSVFFLDQKFSLGFLGLFFVTSFLVIFLVIQIRVEFFIYNRIRSIYKEASLFEIDDLKKAALSTNMETLSKEVKKFAENKQIEITNLYAQESYRREFLGNVSHELKTPLFTIQGYLLTLLDGAADDPVIRNKYIQRASKGVERLVSIVKDLDMISKLESNEIGIEPEQFDIVKLIKEVYDLLEIEAEKKNITLTFNKNYDVPILVHADPKNIEQVLINLVFNSLKYGTIGGTTTVSINSYGTNKIQVQVSDTGEGIKPEHQSRLFERFYRVDQSRSREQGGSGLGLSIVKHIIEAHGETIEVESTHGVGSTFSFTLKNVK